MPVPDAVDVPVRLEAETFATGFGSGEGIQSNLYPALASMWKALSFTDALIPSKASNLAATVVSVSVADVISTDCLCILPVFVSIILMWTVPSVTGGFISDRFSSSGYVPSRLVKEASRLVSLLWLGTPCTWSLLISFMILYASVSRRFL